MVEDERLTQAQRQHRRNVRLALVIAGVALALYFGLWLKALL